MIEVEAIDKVAVLRMQHGKANALDIEFCTALAARFEALRHEASAIVLIAPALPAGAAARR